MLNLDKEIQQHINALKYEEARRFQLERLRQDYEYNMDWRERNELDNQRRNLEDNYNA